MISCMQDVVPESPTVERLMEELGTIGEENWPTDCKRWSVLAQIDAKKAELKALDAELDALDNQSEAENKAEENARATQTALARPAFTPTPTLVPPTEETPAP